MSTKTYTKSGYIIKWAEGKHVFYRCCCKEEDLPILKLPERWRIYRTANMVYYTNYEDVDLLQTRAKRS